MNIAVLLTCHNRCDKTQRCLQSLKKAIEVYVASSGELHFEIFLTDDGSTDGTSESARAVFPYETELHIFNGNGSLYWAGGMRKCWKEAMNNHTIWNYYLLVNDDTELLENMFEELFTAERYAQYQFGREAIVSGFTSSKKQPYTVTYGGSIWKNKVWATTIRLEPTGRPQQCELTNANILLVPKTVVDEIGIFYEGYQHGIADFDYSNTARRSGIPVLLTGNFCGRCDRDHTDPQVEAQKIIAMALKERRAYFVNPLHSNCDYMKFVRRTSPMRYPMVWFGRLLNLYMPKLYYKMNGVR